MGTTNDKELAELQERRMVLSAHLGKNVIVEGVLYRLLDINHKGVGLLNSAYVELLPSDIKEVKPELRTYEQMTKEEKKMLLELTHYPYGSFVDDMANTKEGVAYLLSIGVDVYGWLDKGWALPVEVGNDDPNIVSIEQMMDNFMAINDLQKAFGLDTCVEGGGE